MNKNKEEVVEYTLDWFDEVDDDYETDPEIETYGILLELAGQVSSRIKEMGLSQTELAKRLGKSKSWISKFLNTPTNMSLLKIIEMGKPLGLKVHIAYEVSEAFAQPVSPQLVAANNITAHLPVSEISSRKFDVLGVVSRQEVSSGANVYKMPVAKVALNTNSGYAANTNAFEYELKRVEAA